MSSSELLPVVLALAVAAAIAVVGCLVLAVMLMLERRRHAALEGRIRQLAQEQLRAWQQKELEGLREQEKQLARREAATHLEAWKISHEADIRQDAIVRSQSVIVGKVTEHLAPYLPEFPYNPKDARFIGSPIDILVFDGADEGFVEEIVFLEIKTGNSGLSARQRQIRDAVLAGRVRWLELRL